MEFGHRHTSNWITLNDGVMGGRSIGKMSWAADHMHWEGQTSLQNNGGFASVRSPWSSMDLSGMSAVVIVCKGTGGPFKLTLETSQQWWMPYAYASFTPSNDWSEITIPLKAFQWSQAQLGDLKTVSSKELREVLRSGLMKYDGTASAFELEVKSIAFQ